MLFHQLFNSESNLNFNTRVFEDEVWEYHFHKNLELIYVLEGALECRVNDVDYRLSAGEFGLCLPYDFHSYNPSPKAKYWVLVFSEDFVRYFSKKIVNKVGNGYAFALKPQIKDYVLSQLVFSPEPTIFTLKSCLYAICEEYLNNVELIDKNRGHAETISQIIDFVAVNHTKKITLSDIAKELGYDYNYMSRLFKNVFNANFSDFINMYRLETAVRLLDETSENVTEIALESGFQSVRSFHEYFKKRMGMSPSEYRKTSRK